MVINIPDWCKLGSKIEWYAPRWTGLEEWVKEKVIGYTYDGFLHQAPDCPIYRTEFSEYGKTVREVK